MDALRRAEVRLRRCASGSAAAHSIATTRALILLSSSLLMLVVLSLFSLSSLSFPPHTLSGGAGAAPHTVTQVSSERSSIGYAKLAFKKRRNHRARGGGAAKPTNVVELYLADRRTCGFLRPAERFERAASAQIFGGELGESCSQLCARKKVRDRSYSIPLHVCLANPSHSLTHTI